MEADWIDNRAEEVPFAGILAALIAGNLERDPRKAAAFKQMRGAAAIALPDLETAVTCVFTKGRCRIEAGTAGRPDLTISAGTDRIMDLNLLKIVGGLPWVFDPAGRTVLMHLVSGRVKIDGMLRHPLLLLRLTRIMSVV